MNTLIPSFPRVFPISLLGVAFLIFAQAAPATSADQSAQTFLSAYDKVGTALADDDLDAAKRAAKLLPKNPHAAALLESRDLEQARNAFRPLSQDAIKLAITTNGFLVFHCPMAKEGYWVQTSSECANPYYGKSMLRCGFPLDQAQVKELVKKFNR